jgi:hypothetical protein
MVLCAVLFVALAGIRSVRADEVFKLDIDLALRGGEDGAMVAVPRFALRTEQRFASGDWYYSKYFLGLRYDPSKTVSLAGYWVYQELRPVDGTEQLMVADVTLGGGEGRFSFQNRNRAEWRFTSDYCSYRNKLEVAGKMGSGRLRLFVSEEFRIDADQRRINAWEFQAGLRLQPAPPFRLKIYFSRQLYRRGLPEWYATDFIGLLIYVQR